MMDDHRTLRWLFSVYPREEIRDAVCTSRSLNRKTARYWQLFFQLKEDEMRSFERKTDNLF